MIDERFTIKPQDDYWAVVDNYNDDKVCIINGIHTEIEAEWLCDFMNKQQATINKQEEIIKSQDMEISRQYNLCLAMSGILREEFGVYDVFDRTKDKNIKKEG